MNEFVFYELSVLEGRSEVETYQSALKEMWIAAVSPESYQYAAERGLGVLAGPLKPIYLVLDDHGRVLSGGPRGGETDRAGQHLVVLPSASEARGAGARTTPVGYEYYAALRQLRDMLGGEVTFEFLEESGLIVAGNPEYCAEKVRELQGYEIGYLLCVMAAGGAPHDKVVEPIETFIRCVPRQGWRATRTFSSEFGRKGKRGGLRCTRA